MIRKLLIIAFAAGLLAGPQPAQAGSAMAFPAVVIESVGPAASLPGWLEIKGKNFNSPMVSTYDHLVYFFNQDGASRGTLSWVDIARAGGSWADDKIVFQMPTTPDVGKLGVSVGNNWSTPKPLSYTIPVSLTVQAVQDSKGWWVETYPYVLPASSPETWSVVYQLSPQLCGDDQPLVDGVYCEYVPNWSLPTGNAAIQDFKVQEGSWGWVTVQVIMTPNGDGGRAAVENARVFIPQTKWQLYLPLVVH